MRPCALERASNPAQAFASASAYPAGDVQVRAPTQFLAGGTNLLDLMKLDVARPRLLVDINALRSAHGAILADETGLQLARSRGWRRRPSIP